jgi:hypothetical protein
MTLEPLGVATARLAAGCIEEWPADAPVITVTIPRGSFHANITSDRGASVNGCLGGHRTSLVGMQAAMVARQVGGAFTATVRVEGIDANGGRPGRAVVVRFVQGTRSARGARPDQLDEESE